MFKDALRDVVERTEGSIAGLLMGYDGIPVEHYAKSGAKLDVESIGMEYSVIISQISKAAELLEAGSAREVSIKADKQTTLIRLVNDEYFIAMTIAPEGNLGKARYLLRMLSPKLLQELT
jgi:predicted regulator of Ras-like GTPase activity (Roadblock/LC7/MglB family)